MKVNKKLLALLVALAATLLAYACVHSNRVNQSEIPETQEVEAGSTEPEAPLPKSWKDGMWNEAVLNRAVYHATRILKDKYGEETGTCYTLNITCYNNAIFTVEVKFPNEDEAVTATLDARWKGQEAWTRVGKDKFEYEINSRDERINFTETYPSNPDVGDTAQDDTIEDTVDTNAQTVEDSGVTVIEYVVPEVVWDDAIENPPAIPTPDENSRCVRDTVITFSNEWAGRWYPWTEGTDVPDVETIALNATSHSTWGSLGHFIYTENNHCYYWDGMFLTKDGEEIPGVCGIVYNPDSNIMYLGYDKVYAEYEAYWAAVEAAENTAEESTAEEVAA